MVHDLSLYDFELPGVTEWLAGDNRTLAFQVTDAQENPIDITNATVEWRLYDRAYQDPADAVLDGSDADVEIVTDNRVDTTNGEFEVRVGSAATDGLWGSFTQEPVVTQSDGSEAKWTGDVVLTA